jgi:ABC-2 type transport system ATP-binding protein
MDEASELCDRVAIINEGRIVAIDAPEKLRMATSRMHSVEVSFDDAVPADSLAQLPGVNTVKKWGDKYRLYTAHPGDLVVSLVNYSCSSGRKIVSLNTLAPSLEDAFVHLTEEQASDA